VLCFHSTKYHYRKINLDPNPSHDLHSEYLAFKIEWAIMQIGYARVSSTDQDFDAQVERLKAHGCEKVFSEKASGRSTNGRHELSKALRALKPGDTLIVVRLDRLARSIRDLLSLLDTIKASEAHIKALEDSWLDTTTPHGELILTIMGGMHEFERKLIRARCDEGIRRAKAKGTRFGRKPALDASQRRKIAERYSQGETMAELARDYGVGEATIWRSMHPAGR
jgi:DNA invertase Pin-like site-specific DNA recombinase